MTTQPNTFPRRGCTPDPFTAALARRTDDVSTCSPGALLNFKRNVLVDVMGRVNDLPGLEWSARRDVSRMLRAMCREGDGE